MPIDFRLVNGVDFAQQASGILQDAWPAPALRYTPAYLRWQMSFPSIAGMPAVAAFAGAEPVGFAAASARRLRQGNRELEAAIVSFVGVRPEWQRQGIAAGLYRTLLDALARAGTPVVTFASTATAGERALLRAYTEAGFRIDAMGTYSNYGYMGKASGVQSDWRCYCSNDARILESLAAQLESDGAVLWSWPKGAQLEHYFADPRPRKLIVMEHGSSGVRGAGFAVQSEFRTAQGVTVITTVESVWLSGAATAGVQSLLQAAAQAWDTRGARLLTCPNLSGVEDAALAAMRARKTGGRFSGYFCSAGAKQWPAFERTNLEIV